MARYWLNLFLSCNILFCPSMVIESFAGYSNLGWHPWSLNVCTMLDHDFLAFIISNEKSVILIGLLWSAPSEFPGSDVYKPAEDPAQTYTLRGPKFRLGPAEVSSSCLFPLMSQTNTWTHRCPGSGLLLLRFQAYI